MWRCGFPGYIFYFVTNEAFFTAFLEKIAIINSGDTPWKLIAMGALLFVWILSSLKLHNNQVSDLCNESKGWNPDQSSHLVSIPLKMKPLKMRSQWMQIPTILLWILQFLALMAKKTTHRLHHHWTKMRRDHLYSTLMQNPKRESEPRILYCERHPCSCRFYFRVQRGNKRYGTPAIRAQHQDHTTGE